VTIISIGHEIKLAIIIWEAILPYSIHPPRSINLTVLILTFLYSLYKYTPIFSILISAKIIYLL